MGIDPCEEKHEDGEGQTLHMKTGGNKDVV